MKVILYGLGKMGQRVYALCPYENVEVVAGVDLSPPNLSIPVFSSLNDCTVKADAIIDFSSDTHLSPRLLYAKKHRLKMVIATTGIGEEEFSLIQKFSKEIPIFYSANFSPTLFAFSKIVQLAKFLLPTFDVEIVETHHKNKLDSPSGTAKALAEQIENPPVHSLRGGTVIGDHAVYLFGNQEKITLTHSAESRDIFARGSLLACQFLEDKEKGFFTMKDLLKNSFKRA